MLFLATYYGLAMDQPSAIFIRAAQNILEILRASERHAKVWEAWNVDTKINKMEK